MLAAATDGKPRTLNASLLERSKLLLRKKSGYFYSIFSVRRNLLRQKSVTENFAWKKIGGIGLRNIIRGKLSRKLIVYLSWTISGKSILRENHSWKNCRK